MTAYNTPDFSLRSPAARDTLGATMAARVGAPAPLFEAPLLDGATFRLSDALGARHVVLMSGAITSPMAAIQLPAMNALFEEFDPKGISFYLLYAKESHPAENYPHHTSLEQKMRHARDFQRLEKPLFPIIVDSLEGDTHRAYGPWPTSLFVIHRSGMLIYRTNMTNPVSLGTYLEQLTEWDRLEREYPGDVPHIGYSECLMRQHADEAEHERVYRQAGPKAFEDYWKFHPEHRGKWPTSRSR